MTVCTGNPIILLMGFLISLVVAVLAYRFILKRIKPKRDWVSTVASVVISIVASLIIFVVLFFIAFYITSSIAVSCTGPLIGSGGEILG